MLASFPECPSDILTMAETAEQAAAAMRSNPVLRGGVPNAISPASAEGHRFCRAPKDMQPCRLEWL